MSSLAMEVEATLSSLDPPTAAKFERLIRDAVELVRPAARNPAILDNSYFDSVIGAFSDVEFARPAQGELPSAKTW
ncbi:MAG: hypothetical protein ABIS50_13815 [Luteolibacter sp.]|uniref:hypothetical protein n=1 Tax=Luteolibacter sp. TaxID=1962973 RepID=UPI0032645E65